MLFDYRSRRPVLDMIDGTLTRLVWPSLEMHRGGVDGRDLLVLHGAEPDFRWKELGDDILELCLRLGVVEWVSLGAIPAAVPHTRAVPVLATASDDGLLHEAETRDRPGCCGCRAPACPRCELAVSGSGIPAVGFYAQVPHYVGGPFAAATLALLQHLVPPLGIELPLGSFERGRRPAAEPPGRRRRSRRGRPRGPRAARERAERRGDPHGRRARRRDRAVPAARGARRAGPRRRLTASGVRDARARSLHRAWRPPRIRSYSRSAMPRDARRRRTHDAVRGSGDARRLQHHGHHVGARLEPSGGHGHAPRRRWSPSSSDDPHVRERRTLLGGDRLRLAGPTSTGGSDATGRTGGRSRRRAPRARSPCGASITVALPARSRPRSYHAGHEPRDVERARSARTSLVLVGPPPAGRECTSALAGATHAVEARGLLRPC